MSEADADDLDSDDDDADYLAPKKPAVGPVTIWIGVFHARVSATAAHDAARDILALLADSQITDVDVDFRESLYMRQAGPQLLKPARLFDALVNVISPLTPALGLHISTTTGPNVEGTMGLYLSEGGESNRLLGLTCNHVLFEASEGRVDYTYDQSMPAKNVVLLGKKARANLAENIRLMITSSAFSLKTFKARIQDTVEREKSSDPDVVANAKATRTYTEALLCYENIALEELVDLINRVSTEWKHLDRRVLGSVVRAPGLKLGVGAERFTEDWGVFCVNRDKLGAGFRGNQIFLGAVRFECPDCSHTDLHAQVTAPLTRPGCMYRVDRKSTRLNSSHSGESRMPSSA